MKLKHPQDHRDQDTLRQKGERNGYMLAILPRPQGQHTSYGEVSPEHLVLPVRKEKPERTNSLTAHCRSFSRSSHFDPVPWGLQRNQQDPATGSLTVTEKGEGLATISMRILAN